ncbi:MAG: helix-turn-helix domain-containing protein [Lactobacillaceae bacterium]|jgi:transcriptional regulator with XRE-family HTH domain|nr:helix-turn-helix domain-containing protein [Lactobacillaceae bacterium]
MIKNLRLIRKTLSMTTYLAAEELSEKFPDRKISQARYANWERGNNDPSIPDIINLTIYFGEKIDSKMVEIVPALKKFTNGISMDYLVGFDDGLLRYKEIEAKLALINKDNEADDIMNAAYLILFIQDQLNVVGEG